MVDFGRALGRSGLIRRSRGSWSPSRSVLGLASIALPIEVVFAKHTLHAGDAGFGLMLTAWGVGMILGGFAFAIGSEIRLMPMVGVSTMLNALGYAGMAVSPTLATACVFSCVGGVGNGAAWVAARTALQQRIPLSRQAAVMSVLEAANQVMPALGFIVGGVLTALTSPRLAYAASAVGVAAVVAWFTIRPIDQVRLSTTAATDGASFPDAEMETQDNGQPQRTPSAPTRTTG